MKYATFSDLKLSRERGKENLGKKDFFLELENMCKCYYIVRIKYWTLPTISKIHLSNTGLSLVELGLLSQISLKAFMDNIFHVILPKWKLLLGNYVNV